VTLQPFCRDRDRDRDRDGAVTLARRFRVPAWLGFAVTAGDIDKRAPSSRRSYRLVLMVAGCSLPTTSRCDGFYKRHHTIPSTSGGAIASIGL